MYNEEKMNKALRAFEWDFAVALLPEQTVESLRELLGSVSRSGCLIRLHKISSEDEELRAHFIEELRHLCATIGSNEGADYCEFLLRQVDIVELALAEIETTLDLDEFSSLPPDVQVWSAISWTAREMLDVHRQMQAVLNERKDGRGVVIDPLTLRVDKEHGYGLAAGRIHQLSQTVANTIRMLGHRHRWGIGSSLQLPARTCVSEKDMAAAERILRLGDVWQVVLDESKHHRFWGGHFVVRDPKAEEKEIFPKLEHVIMSEKTERDRRDDVQVSEYIALNRMQRKQLSTSQNISRSNAKDRIKDPRTSSVQLAPTELVSELEMATLYTLDMVMYFNPMQNETLFGGLTILEWLRGYCILEESYAGEVPDDSGGIIELEQAEFRATLQRGGLTSAKANTFLERVIFQAGRRDLYDAPLLRTGDGQLFFLAALYRGIDVALIISSQLGTQKLNVDEKGKAFEKAVLKMFTDAGLTAKTFKFTVRNTQYDCDVAVLWDGHLFIFECKNYSLPADDAADRLFFWKRQVEARDQVERIAQDLSDHPEIVRANFGQDATWGEIHVAVLNASFLSFPRSRSGTFFYDASALGRFLQEGTLNEIHSHPHEGGRIDVSVEVMRLWDGEHPAPSDLLREMENPSQVRLERDQYYIARKLLSLSVSSALMLEEAASKPPDFEPL
jgi:hypothetical protein